MKIYSIRHGQTTGDIEGRFGGTYDDNLSDKGVKQANELAEKLKNFGIEIIYSSPYFRARETAEILAKKLNISVRIVNDLRERDVCGQLSGKLKSDYPKEVELLKDCHYTFQGGEEYLPFKKRVLKSINDIGKAKYQTVAFVFHGGPIKCFFREVFGKEIEPGDCEVLEIEYQNNRYKLTC